MHHLKKLWQYDVAHVFCATFWCRHKFYSSLWQCGENHKRTNFLDDYVDTTVNNLYYIICIYIDSGRQIPSSLKAISNSQASDTGWFASRCFMNFDHILIILSRTNRTFTDHFLQFCFCLVSLSVVWLQLLAT